MKLYFSGIDKGKSNVLNEIRPENILISYWTIKNSSIVETISRLEYSPTIFLDSGAFSAMTQGAKVSISDYGKFILKNRQYLEVYANLDVIYEPELTLDNQKFLEEMNLSPLPVFHVGEEWKWLEMYCKKYDYVALGGMVPYAGKKTKLLKFMKKSFEIAKEHKTKLHGFGCNNSWLLNSFDFYSVDSRSWLMAHRNRTFVTESLKPITREAFKEKFNINLSQLTDHQSLVLSMRKYANWERRLNSKKIKHYWE